MDKYYKISDGFAFSIHSDPLDDFLPEDEVVLDTDMSMDYFAKVVIEDEDLVVIKITNAEKIKNDVIPSRYMSVLSGEDTLVIVSDPHGRGDPPEHMTFSQVLKTFRTVENDSPGLFYLFESDEEIEEYVPDFKTFTDIDTAIMQDLF